MTKQGKLFDPLTSGPYAETTRGLVQRNGHKTSQQAADTQLPNMTAMMIEVLDQFKFHHDLTDEELGGLSYFAPKGYAESTVRKRRTTLYQLGFIEPLADQHERQQQVIAGTKLNKNRVSVIIWTITQKGRDY